MRVMLLFFSSRRRHTRLVSDWSSDVCSSDLVCVAILAAGMSLGTAGMVIAQNGPGLPVSPAPVGAVNSASSTRSEERRVGKECRSRGAWDQWKKKNESRAETAARGLGRRGLD